MKTILKNCKLSTPPYSEEKLYDIFIEGGLIADIGENLHVAKRPTSEKAKTPFGRYSGKYALSTLVVCGKCGALYRRVTWYRKGEKQIMWRCGTRLDGKANCPDSPTIEETILQAAVKISAATATLQSAACAFSVNSE